ncbi:MAG: iron-containing alcohol dehydrogenase, partial [Desulfobulbaceae bacterium]|nr:iron-containing alcohol dehydrogenase [Desulfobulbaceae bacterium]
IPAWLTWYARVRPERIAELGGRLFHLEGDDVGEVAARTISHFKEWFSQVNSPVSLAQVNIPPEDIPAIAENALKLAKIWRLKQYSQEIIEEILRMAR